MGFARKTSLIVHGHGVTPSLDAAPSFLPSTSRLPFARLDPSLARVPSKLTTMPARSVLRVPLGGSDRWGCPFHRPNSSPFRSLDPSHPRRNRCGGSSIQLWLLRQSDSPASRVELRGERMVCDDRQSRSHGHSPDQYRQHSNFHQLTPDIKKFPVHNAMRPILTSSRDRSLERGLMKGVIELEECRKQMPLRGRAGLSRRLRSVTNL